MGQRNMAFVGVVFFAYMCHQASVTGQSSLPNVKGHQSPTSDDIETVLIPYNDVPRRLETQKIPQHDKVHVIAKHGRIVVNPPVDCVITINSTTLLLKKNETSSFLFGFIRYNCEGFEGEVHSHPMCMSCGIFCPVNEKIARCSSERFLQCVAGFVGVLLGGITVLLVGKYHRACVTYFVKNVQESKRNKRISKCKKLIKTIRSLDDDGRAEVFSASGIEPPRSSDISLNSPGGAEYRNMHPLSSLKMTMTLCCVLGVLGMHRPVLACDMIVYIASEQTVCNQNTCHQVNGYSFPIGEGSTVCFNVGEQTAFKVTLEATHVWTIYELQYYTQEYKIDTEVTWNCMGSPGAQLSCWTNGCRAGTKHPDFKASHSKIDIYNCKWSSTTCEGGLGCSHGSKCIWYHWWVTPVGDLYPVYLQTVEYWNATFLIESSRGKTRTHINNAVPTYFPYDAVFSELMFAVSSMSHPRIIQPKNIVRLGGEIVGVEACPLDTPVLGMLGEFQVADNEQSWKFPTASIDCQVNNCITKCKTGNQALSSLKTRKRQKENRQFMLLGNQELATIQPIRSTATVVLGNLNIKNLIVKLAMCRFEVTKVYGCEGCSLLPYVVVKPYDIKEYGTVYFESDCPFLQNTLSCGRFSTILNLQRSDVNKCYIYIPSSNQTLNFNITLDFVGEMSDNGLVYYGNDDPYQSVKAVLTSSTFINTALFSYLGLSVVGSVITILAMLAKTCATVKYANQITRDTERNLLRT